MIRDLQVKTTMNFALCRHALNHDLKEPLDFNWLRKLWLKYEVNDTFIPKNILDVEHHETLSPKRVRALNKIFHLEADEKGKIEYFDELESVFHFGPGGSLLWSALEGADSGRATVSALAMIFECDENTVRRYSDKFWKLCVRELPEISFHILAYYIYVFYETRSGSKSMGLLRNSNIMSIESLCMRGNFREQLHLYDLRLQDLFEVIHSRRVNKKESLKNCPNFEPPITSFEQRVYLQKLADS